MTETSPDEQIGATLYTAWFCPFAQRAAIACAQKEVNPKVVEIQLYLPDGKRNPEKPACFMQCNPLGLVPAFSDSLIQSYVEKGLPGVYESLVVVEYVDEKFKTGKKIIPEDPYLAAQARIWTAWVGEKFAPHTNRILRSRSSEIQRQSFESLLSSIRCLNSFLLKLSPGGGTFLGSNDTLCLFDIALIPFAWRSVILLQKFRNLTIPTGSEYERFHSWYRAVYQTKAFQSTLPKAGEDCLVGVYRKYVDIEP